MLAGIQPLSPHPVSAGESAPDRQPTLPRPPRTPFRRGPRGHRPKPSRARHERAEHREADPSRHGDRVTVRPPRPRTWIVLAVALLASAAWSALASAQNTYTWNKTA